MQAAAPQDAHEPAPPMPVTTQTTHTPSGHSSFGPDVVGGAILVGVAGSVFAGLPGLVGGVIAVPALHALIGLLARKHQQHKH